MSNKNIDYRLYLYLLELSNFNKSDDVDYRFLYLNKLKIYKATILEEMNISDQVYRKRFNKLKNANLIEYTEVNNDIVLKIRVKKNNKNFVILSDMERFRLQDLNSNQIKAYLVLRYTRENRNNIQMIHLSDKLGLSVKNTTTAKKIFNELAELELIEYYTKERINKKINRAGNINIIKNIEYFFSIKDLSF